MTTYLLDANALIALTVVEHEHHRRATAWAATAEQLAICPVVEGALIRFLVRLGESVVTATELLRAVAALPRCEFWTDSVSYVDVGLAHVRGHRQVTDAYLAALAHAHDGRLATFDQALASALPASVTLIPVDRS